MKARVLAVFSCSHREKFHYNREKSQGTPKLRLKSLIGSDSIITAKKVHGFVCCTSSPAFGQVLEKGTKAGQLHLICRSLAPSRGGLSTKNHVTEAAVSRANRPRDGG